MHQKLSALITTKLQSASYGTPKGILIITMGEVSGIIEHQNESGLSGFCIVPIATINPRIIGMVTGSINC